jgi:hypothetical protein
MKTFKKFIRSRNGMLSLFGGLIVLLLIAAYFGGAFGGITGTAGIPTYPTYPLPPTEGNYTCLPTCDPTDAKMFVLAGADQNSMSNTPIKIWVMVPGDQPSFKLGIFDGDTSKAEDNTLKVLPNGYFDARSGNWDNAIDADTTYTLYADPLADNSGMTALASWMGNEVMLNNAWWETTIDRNELAKAPNGHYYYRLEASRPKEGNGMQVFKVRATGYVFTGQREEWAVGLVGALLSKSDRQIVYPESTSGTNLGSKSTYNGDWQVYFYIPQNIKSFEVWDGDFDRGTKSVPDSDDPNTQGKPTWATSFAVDEGIGGGNGAGKPNDDIVSNIYRVSPSVTYEILDPHGQPVFTNDNPSGTEEWEKYEVSVSQSDNPDVLASGALTPGMYNIHIKGLDLFNSVWIGVNYPLCDPNGGCPPPPWVEGTCPRTIGYWKNNVKKIYIENKTNGIQESKASLDWGLRNVALASKLYRSGINVQNPVAIETATPLTPAEADKILQKANGNSMLDRALQQTLAAYLNLATGKIGPNSQIIITNISSGPFDGTMMEALRFSEDVILDPAKRADAKLLERAKDISDMINNNMLTNTSEPDPLQACGVYQGDTGVVPAKKQPPTHDKMPKAPKPAPEPVKPAPAPVCTAGNTYTVENTTNNPFYSVKFNFASGTEVKEGGYDTFKYTLPADVVTAMTDMQVHVKAATDARDYTLTCDFTTPAGCAKPVSDDAYSVSFDGATDNGDGTYTLSFTISIFGQHGLSDVAFSLPEGQIAGGVTENYTTETCVAP